MKTTHLLEWPKYKILRTPNAGESVEHKELSFTAAGNTKWCSHFERQFGKFLTKLIILLTYDPAIMVFANEWKTCPYKKLHVNVIAVLFIVAKLGRNQDILQ